MNAAISQYPATALQIGTEPTRQTIPYSFDCIYSHQPQNNALCTAIKQAF